MQSPLRPMHLGKQESIYRMSSLLLPAIQTVPKAPLFQLPTLRPFLNSYLRLKARVPAGPDTLTSTLDMHGLGWL
jgi:hypothetical protein